MRGAMRVAVILAVLGGPVAAFADECGDAVRDYNAVLLEMNAATEKFSACVAESLGKNNCATEFRHLQLVYGQYQAAVAVYIRQCL